MEKNISMLSIYVSPISVHKPQSKRVVTNRLVDREMCGNLIGVFLFDCRTLKITKEIEDIYLPKIEKRNVLTET